MAQFCGTLVHNYPLRFFIIMSTITFDTLKFSQRLEKAGATREYVIAEAEALSEIFETGTQDLATKADVKSLEATMETRLAEVKLDLIKWIIGLILGQTALLLTVLPKILCY